MKCFSFGQSTAVPGFYFELFVRNILPTTVLLANLSEFGRKLL